MLIIMPEFNPATMNPAAIILPKEKPNNMYNIIIVILILIILIIMIINIRSNYTDNNKN